MTLPDDQPDARSAGADGSAAPEPVLVERFPAPDDYRRLRTDVGMSPKSAEAAVLGLAGTRYGVSLLDAQRRVVGMGRVIGDGGCFFVVVDIAVDRAWQGRGQGKRIVAALDAWLRANAPVSAHVSLFADGEARHLYAKYGFVETGQASVGMEYVIRPEA